MDPFCGKFCAHTLRGQAPRSSSHPTQAIRVPWPLVLCTIQDSMALPAVSAERALRGVVVLPT
jgi:hypothetical protein